MKKKSLIFISLLIVLLMLSSCTIIPGSRLEAMFRPGGSSSVIGTGGAADTSGDSVTISREEYEKYRKFSEMYEIFDAANQGYYVEPDESKMIEYATRGLMAGLDDPYSYYYNPEEYAEMWEDDEGNYVGIGAVVRLHVVLIGIIDCHKSEHHQGQE